MKILVTGGTGLVGSSFNEIKTNHDILLVGRQHANLLHEKDFTKLLIKESPDAVIHLAAKVGGVKGNTDFVSDFYFENIMINTNVLNSCNKIGIEKVVSLLSTCIYPDKVNYPLTEEQIHLGPPHISNYGYAYAKRMLDIHSNSLRDQYNKKYICAVPNNIYGKKDNFDLENGHVIPAIVRKIYEAKNKNLEPTFWGDGSPLREFTYASDIAKSLIFVLENYDDSSPINIGNPEERSIKSIVEKVSEFMKYDGAIKWDKTKPSGQFRKPSSNNKFLDLGWDNSDYTDFDVGLKKTCDWFINNYPNVRGVK